MTVGQATDMLQRNCSKIKFVGVYWPLVSESAIFLPLSFRALDWGDPYGIFGKALQILKLESLGQPMAKI